MCPHNNHDDNDRNPYSALPFRISVSRDARRSTSTSTSTTSTDTIDHDHHHDNHTYTPPSSAGDNDDHDHDQCSVIRAKVDMLDWATDCVLNASRCEGNRCGFGVLEGVPDEHIRQFGVAVERFRILMRVISEIAGEQAADGRQG